MKPSAILFDCDGVLVDSEIVYISVELEHLAKLGLHYDQADYKSRFGGLPEASYEREVARDYARLNKGPIPQSFNNGIIKECKARFEKELVEVSGAARFFGDLEMPMAVASSSAMDRLHWKLQRTGLHHHFEPHIYSGDQVENGKPAPDLFLFAASKLGVSPLDCVVIEDSSNGVKAGVAAGMQVWGFTAGSHADAGLSDRLKNAGATEVISSYENLGSRLAAN